MATWKQSFLYLNENLGVVLKRAFLPAFQITFFPTVLIYYFHSLKAEPRTDLIWATIFEIVVTIALGIFYSLILVHVLAPKTRHMGLHIKTHLKQVTIETLRTFPHIIAYSLLLLIPGIIKMVQLSFVPFVTQRHSSYLAGKVDALKESTQLTRGLLLPLTLLYVLFQAAIVLCQTIFPKWLGDWVGMPEDAPGRIVINVLFVSIIGLFVELVCLTLFFGSFLNSVIHKEGKNELAI